MVNINDVIEQLIILGLTRDQAIIYFELAKKETNHLQLSRDTGINRTKVYRIIQDLEMRGLAVRVADDRGLLLTAGDVGVLDEVVRKCEQRAMRQRQALESVGGMLAAAAPQSAHEFVVHTYKGVAGMKQMQWHELKTKGELLAFGYVTYEELVGSRRWAEGFRFKVSQQGYKIRELISRTPPGFAADFTNCVFYYKKYQARRLIGVALPVCSPFVVYNDTVAIYQIDAKKKFGLEIINAGYATTMRQVFEDYWRAAQEF